MALIKMYKILTKPVVRYGSATGTLTQAAEQILKVKVKVKSVCGSFSTDA
jgi:hypothetical protein